VEDSYVLDHSIFETVTGSQAYGTSTPESDTDRTGVMVPGPDYTMGLQSDFGEFGFESVDRKFYCIHKFLSLALENNPNILDLLWTPERCIQYMRPCWSYLLDSIRDHILSKRCRYTYGSYAIGQLRRISVHRKFLLNPPKSAPTRTEFGLPEESLFPTSQLKAVCYAAIQAIPNHNRTDFFKRLDEIYGDWVIPLFARYLDPKQRVLAMDWLQKGIRSQAHALQALGTKFLKDEYADMAAKEVLYLNRMQEWKQYDSWKKHRNKKRAALEEKYGYDSKHAMHLIRILRMGAEILEQGKVNVDRTDIDAEELKAIRDGAWSYDKVEAYANYMSGQLEELSKGSNLPMYPDPEVVNSASIIVHKEFYRKLGYV